MQVMVAGLSLREHWPCSSPVALGRGQAECKVLWLGASHKVRREVGLKPSTCPWTPRPHSSGKTKALAPGGWARYLNSLPKAKAKERPEGHHPSIQKQRPGLETVVMGPDHYTHHTARRLAC